MPNLLERATSLRAEIHLLAQSDNERDRLERLRTRAEQISSAAKRLDEAYSSLRLLQIANIAPKTPPKPSNALRNKAPQLRKDLATDWRAFAERGDISTTFVDRVVDHAEKLQDTLRSTWHDYVDDGLPDIRDDFLLAFANAGFAEECEQLRALSKSIEQCRLTLPQSTAHFAELGRLKNNIQSVWGELKGVPKDVIDFLRKASARQAVFTDLTPTIQMWLDKRGMLVKLRIGLG